MSIKNLCKNKVDTGRHDLLVVLFGLPGVGKSYIGSLMHKHLEFYFYDADADIPVSMENAILAGQLPASDARQEHVIRMSFRVKRLRKQYAQIVVANAFIKEQYRMCFAIELPDEVFVWVKSDPYIRRVRLSYRTRHIVSDRYTKILEQDFEEPRIRHLTIDNSIAGDKALIDSMTKILGL